MRETVFKPDLARFAAAFLILFTLYQSAEGVGALLLHSFAIQAALMTLCVVAAFPVGRYLLGYRGYDAYALEWRRGAAGFLAGTFLLAMIAKALAVIVGIRIGVYWIASGAGDASSLSLIALALALVSTFIPSIAEDIVTRGIWWRGAAWRSGPAFVAVSSLIYVLNHIYRLGAGPLEWLMLFCFGIAYATALVRSGTLWAAVGLHWGWNFANALLERALPLDADASLTPWLSASAHLLMAGLVLLYPRGGGGTGAPQERPSIKEGHGKEQQS